MSVGGRLRLVRAAHWLRPGLRLKRHMALGLGGIALAGLGAGGLWGGRAVPLGLPLSVLAVLLGIALAVRGGWKLVVGLVERLVPSAEPGGELSARVYRSVSRDRGPRIVALGGGTGLPVLLRGLKAYTGHITAVVAVSDDGGSSGRLRGELKMLPPGDLRNCLTALADTEPLMNRLFQHRFGGDGDLRGHAFGNLFIAAMNEVTGDFEEAIRQSSRVLRVRGQVIPATSEEVSLVAELDDGTTVRGETAIAKTPGRVVRMRLDPERPRPTREAVEAILAADAIVLGPGSLYTSVVPHLLIPEVLQAIRTSPATLVVVGNIMTQPGETDGMTAAMHVDALLAHGLEGRIDWTLWNDAPLAPAVLERYARMGAEPVVVDVAALERHGVRAVLRPLIAEGPLVRHDADRLAREVLRCVLAARGDDPARMLDFLLLGQELRVEPP